ncbi:helix-turn-helix transcriptional regulator [Oceanispirochaeta sp. M2]|nr:helix-turn-helix transcriptional regulator [Oceanispirochaeta sp. M2]NPD73765.1 AraC family transcriptional regulator [Oceanispirochaeta sp. M1]RDG30534.1 AraC family transcriptional regulator [Oceanispirochaeta sp. M1]
MKEENEIQWHSRYHAHGENEFELHYFIQGNGSFLNDKTRFRLEQGTLFLTNPEIHHSIIAQDGSNPISYYAVLLKTDESDREIQRLLTIDLKSNRTYALGTNYRFFFEEIREKGLSGNRALRQSAVHQLISFLYVLSGEEDFHFSDSRNSHIEKALRIMQNNITNDLDLEEIAEKLGLSKSYFIRLFQQKMKTTPMKYFMKLKIEAAGAMLTSTDRSLLTIAQDLNFYSEFHFSRVFKQYTGSAPSVYRKQYLQLAGEHKAAAQESSSPEI